MIARNGHVHRCAARDARVRGSERPPRQLRRRRAPQARHDRVTSRSHHARCRVARPLPLRARGGEGMRVMRDTTRWTTATMVLLATTASADVGGPLSGLTSDQLATFTEGRTVFEEVEDASDGLGPVFNANSCVACHNLGATGGGGDHVETRFGTMTNGAFDPMTSHGGSLIQTDGIGPQGACTFVGEVVPAYATIVAGRRTTPLFGLGLVDAVPDAVFRGLAAYQARFQPEIAGRPNVVTDVVTGKSAVGKFGWKSQVP